MTKVFEVDYFSSENTPATLNALLGFEERNEKLIVLSLQILYISIQLCICGMCWTNSYSTLQPTALEGYGNFMVPNHMESMPWQHVEKE